MKSLKNNTNGGESPGHTAATLVLLLLAIFAAPAAAAVDLTAHHAAAPYIPGSPLVVTVTLDYDTGLSALGMRVVLPTDWTYLYCCGTGRPDSVRVVAPGELELVWINAPEPGAGEDPALSFTYLLGVPASEAETRTLQAEIFYRVGSGAENTAAVLPDPLDVSADPAPESFVEPTHQAARFLAGSLAAVETSVRYSGELSALALVMELPEGWSYASADGEVPDIEPTPGTEGTLEFTWITPPPSPAVFTCRLQTPVDAGNAAEIRSEIVYRRLAEELRKEVQPDPLMLRWVTPEVLQAAPSAIVDSPEAKELVVTGRYFVPGENHIVRFVNSQNVFDLKSLPSDESSLTVAIPPGVPPGTYRLRVINACGISALSEATVEVTAPATPIPNVTDVRPSTGAVQKSTRITLYGAHFNDVSSVCLCEDGLQIALLDVTLVDESTVQATVPSTCPEGIYDVQVTAGGLKNNISTVKFFVFVPRAINSETSDELVADGLVDLDENLNGTLPVNLTLKTWSDGYRMVIDDDPLEIEAVIEAGTRMTRSDGSAYAGALMMPVQVKVTEDLAEDFSWDDVALFQMGSAEESIILSEPMVIALTVSRSAAKGAPLIYYLDADGGTTPAGVAGVKDGREYEAGGTVLEVRADEPEAGKNTYRIGLLLDHMSTFVVGNKGAASGQPPSGGGGKCFIDVADGEIGNFNGGCQVIWGVMVLLAMGLCLVKRMEDQKPQDR